MPLLNLIDRTGCFKEIELILEKRINPETRKKETMRLFFCNGYLSIDVLEADKCKEIELTPSGVRKLKKFLNRLPDKIYLSRKEFHNGK